MGSLSGPTNATVTIGDVIAGGTPNAVLFIDGAGNLADSANLTFDGTLLQSLTGIIAGDPGTEANGIDVGGTTYNAILKASDIGGTYIAHILAHRHSTTLGPLVALSRSNSNTAAHVDVATGQDIGSIYSIGYAGTSYKIFGLSAFYVDAGTISDASAPGMWALSVTPDGSVAPVEQFRINNKGAWGLTGANYGAAGQVLTSTGNATPPTWQAGGGALTAITASLGADVNLNNTALFFDGPSVAQGAVGTWFVSGSVTINDTGGATGIVAKLWDGTTVIASGRANIAAANDITVIALSGYITNPVGNLRISCNDTGLTTGKIYSSVTGLAKDSTITAVRIA